MLNSDLEMLYVQLWQVRVQMNDEHNYHSYNNNKNIFVTIIVTSTYLHFTNAS